LEKEWQPVFDPRGLVGYEARLGAEIRILQLPDGMDPDDVIRDEPDKWAQLVEGSLPVVDFYLRLLIQDIDMEDTKAKAQVVDKLMPVVRAVANPVEREDYLQKIARSLRLDERAVLARLQDSERRHMAPRQRRAVPAEFPESADGYEPERESVTTDHPGAVMESYCLSRLVRRPDLLSQVDRALRRRGLQGVRPQDFEQPGLRAIFEAWTELLDARPSVSVAALRDGLPPGVQDRLDLVLAEEAGPPAVRSTVDISDEQLVRDVVVALCRLRQRRLKQLVQDLKMLMIEAHAEGDSRAKQYDQAHLAHAQTLLKTQRALALSRELG
jgi:DNA primase